VIERKFGPVTTYGVACCYDERWATLLIGEAPNRWMHENARPQAALWREDLAALCGVDLRSFLRLWVRCNLLDEWPGHSVTVGTGSRGKGGGRTKGSRFPLEEAVPRAEALLCELAGGQTPFRRAALFGRRVARAFGVGREQPFFSLFRLRGFPFVVVPHPSGASHWWNDEANVEAARRWWTAAARGQGKAMAAGLAAEWRRAR
jgi:hypothetical protein